MFAFTRHFKNQKGMTLVELLVAGVIGLIAIAAIYQIYISGIRTTVVEEQVVDMQQNIRVAMDQIIRELRLAGYDPDTPGGLGQAILGETYGGATTLVGNTMTLSTPNRFFEFQGDIDDDGTVDIVRYFLDIADPKHPRLMRRGNGVDAPFAENIEEMRLIFYDNTNTLTTNATTIQRVTLMLRARTAEEDSDYKAPLPYSDGYRRRTLESDVMLRNVNTSSQDVTPPPCPTNITVVNNPNECRIIQVTWSVPSDPDGDLEGYYLFYSLNPIPVGQDPKTLNAPFINISNETLSFFNLSVPTDAAYYFAMSSYDASGNFCDPVELSSPTGLAPTGNLPPSSPPNPTATVASKQVAIQWGAVTDTDDITGYRVYRNTVNNPATATLIADENDLTATLTTEGPVHTTQYIDNDLNTAAGGPVDCQFTYYYWVTAVDNCGLESGLAEVKAFDPNTGLPQPGITPPDNDLKPPTPTITSVVAGDDTSVILIDWAVPSPDTSESTPVSVTVYWRPLGTATWDPTIDPAVGTQVIDLTSTSLPTSGQVIVNGLTFNTIYEVKASTMDDPTTTCGDQVDSSISQISTGACAPQIRAHKIVPGIDSYGTSVAPFDTIGTDPNITPTTNQNQYVTWVVDPTDCTPTSGNFDTAGFDYSNPPDYNIVSDNAHIEFFINNPGGGDAPAHTVYPIGTSGSNPGNALHPTNAGDNIDWAPRGADGFYHFPSDPLDPLHIDTFEFCDADYEFKIRVVDGEMFSSEATIPVTILNGSIAIDSNVAVTSNIDTSSDVHHIVTFGILNETSATAFKINKITFSWTNLSAFLERVEVRDSLGGFLGEWNSVGGTPSGRQGTGIELTLNPIPQIQGGDPARVVLTFAKLDGTVNSEVDMRNDTITILEMEVENALSGKECDIQPGNVIVPQDPVIDSQKTFQDQPTPSFVPTTIVGKSSALAVGTTQVNISAEFIQVPTSSIDSNTTAIRYRLTRDARTLAPPRPSTFGGTLGSDGGSWGSLALTYDAGSNTLSGTIPANGTFLDAQVWYYLEVGDVDGNFDILPDNYGLGPNDDDAFTFATCSSILHTVTLDSPLDGSSQTGQTSVSATVSNLAYAINRVTLIVNGQGNIDSQTVQLSQSTADGVVPQTWIGTYDAGPSGSLPHTLVVEAEDVCSVVVVSSVTNIN